MTRHDLAKDPPSRAFLEKHVDASRLDDFLNRRSPSYKERGLGERKLSKREAIDLMLEDPNLMKRPVVLRNGRAVFGYDEAAWDELLGG
ncbi:MAG TPA: ArsC/Spx/MgsR family protein [Thermoanaerobaculia bacterium]|nr:ArsC/Spx/MgsR family protein [Thermoanaerobaculia bacterium]